MPCLARQHPLAIAAENRLIFLFCSGPGASAPQFTLEGRGGRALFLSHQEPKPVASRLGSVWRLMDREERVSET